MNNFYGFGSGCGGYPGYPGYPCYPGAFARPEPSICNYSPRCCRFCDCDRNQFGPPGIPFISPIYEERDRNCRGSNYNSRENHSHSHVRFFEQDTEYDSDDRYRNRNNAYSRYNGYTPVVPLASPYYGAPFYNDFYDGD